MSLVRVSLSNVSASGHGDTDGSRGSGDGVIGCVSVAVGRYGSAPSTGHGGVRIRVGGSGDIVLRISPMLGLSQSQGNNHCASSSFAIPNAGSGA